MTYTLAPCSHPGCSFSHSVHYVRPATPRPRLDDSADLGNVARDRAETGVPCDADR